MSNTSTSIAKMHERQQQQQVTFFTWLFHSNIGLILLTATITLTISSSLSGIKSLLVNSLIRQTGTQGNRSLYYNALTNNITYVPITTTTLSSEIATESISSDTINNEEYYVANPHALWTLLMLLCTIFFNLFILFVMYKWIKRYSFLEHNNNFKTNDTHHQTPLISANANEIIDREVESAEGDSSEEGVPRIL